MGMFGFSLYPACMETAVECTYPVAEATSSGLLFISGYVRLEHEILCYGFHLSLFTILMFIVNLIIFLF